MQKKTGCEGDLKVLSNPKADNVEENDYEEDLKDWNCLQWDEW